jgi:membrane-anchored protein YejM (alkaline phosphatase superfamily)
MAQTQKILRSYFAVMYIGIFITLSLFWGYIEEQNAPLMVFSIAASLGYSLLYLLPAILLTKLSVLLFRPGSVDPGTGSWRVAVVYFVAWFNGTLILLILYADYQLFILYEYHFNAFVWNLITTPGGIAALGATSETNITIATEVTGILLASAALLWSLHRLNGKTSRDILTRRRIVVINSMLLATLLVAESVYAFYKHTGNEAYLQAATAIPFHLRSSATSLFKNLGIGKTGMNKLEIAKGKVNYPLQPLQSKQLDHYPNIIWLTAESFRWDLLDPEITPNLWEFSQQALKFNNHYSGGNRTRMGMFSMFYGLHAPYWFSFQEQRVRPAIMDLLIEKDYQFALHTSQSFTYPELDDTVFADMPEGTLMQELKDGDSWQRDSQNISDILTGLKNRDSSQPFFTFMFFESTHAPYTFPEQAVIRSPYLESMNYAKMNLLGNIGAIHNRYINAAHHIDQEAGRLLDYLEENQLLDNTIVLFTGDHGEEFMENGHWGHGHNNYFPEHQVRVPLILRLPGEKPGEVNYPTSHLQIPHTLLTRLGVTSTRETYSLAGDLFSPEDYLVMGNYNYMSIADDDFKLTFPFTASDYFHFSVYDQNDNQVSRKDKIEIIATYQDKIDQVVEEGRRFVD